MKVYDWKTLIVTVTIGFGLILYKLFELFNGGDLADAVEVLLFSYARYQGLKSSLTEEGYLKDKEKGCIDLSRAGELGVADAYGVIKKYCEENND